MFLSPVMPTDKIKGKIFVESVEACIGVTMKTAPAKLWGYHRSVSLTWASITKYACMVEGITHGLSDRELLLKSDSATKTVSATFVISRVMGKGYQEHF